MSRLHNGILRTNVEHSRWSSYDNPDDADTLQLLINTYRLSSIIFPHLRLVVSDDLAVQLVRISTSRTKPVALPAAFRIPYAAGDRSFQQIPGWNNKEPTSYKVVHKMVELHRCPVPQVQRFELLIKHIDCVADYPNTELLVRGKDEDGWGADWGCRVPSGEVEQHGIIFCGEYFCNERVFRAIEPHLEYPFVLWNEFNV